MAKKPFHTSLYLIQPLECLICIFKLFASEITCNQINIWRERDACFVLEQDVHMLVHQKERRGKKEKRQRYVYGDLKHLFQFDSKIYSS